MICFDAYLSGRSRVPLAFVWLTIATISNIMISNVATPGFAAEPVRLTTDGRVKRDPVVWHDGKQVTYSTVTDEGVSRLMRLDLTDGSTALFHAKETLPDRELTVSADGSIYAYVYVTPDGQRGRVIVKDTQRSTTTTLEPGKFGLWPTLSPDGRYVALTVNAGPMVAVDLSRVEASSTMVIEAKTGGPVSRLTYDDARYGDLWPKYSPNGRSIVFSSRRDDDFEIYLMNADGTGQQRLTESPGVDTHPSFSPDGQRIVFTSARDRNYEIYTMKLDGSDLRRITNDAGRDDFASYYPDGKQLVVVSQRKGRYDLYSIQVDSD
ncbi:MAG: Tol biopolymer transport system component [Pirellulaceae bacterium]|jgi:Tol biopolymer transport system component